jgi:hypothetical protein
MNYTPVEELKNAWIFKHKSLPVSDNDLNKIKPMHTTRSTTLWDTFISKQVDHPDFFKKGDWASNQATWIDNANWEKRWDSEEAELPELITEHINWDNNTVVYFCTSRNNVIETTWAVFKRCWKNFLFMDDGSLLIGKKRKEVVQFLSNGTCKVGNKP